MCRRSGFSYAPANIFLTPYLPPSSRGTPDVKLRVKYNEEISHQPYYIMPWHRKVLPKQGPLQARKNLATLPHTLMAKDSTTLTTCSQKHFSSWPRTFGLNATHDNLFVLCSSEYETSRAAQSMKNNEWMVQANHQRPTFVAMRFSPHLGIVVIATANVIQNITIEAGNVKNINTIESLDFGRNKNWQGFLIHYANP